MTLESLLQNPNALPTAPKVVDELISSFEDPDVAVEDIARKVSLDPVLAAKLLRLANSAYYHVSRRIGNVEDAVRMLGFVTVRTLVISSGLVGGFKTVPGLDLKRFWRYSLHAAVSAKWIAKKVGVNTDLAFTIGMMHAIGQLVVHAGMPAEAQELDKTVGPYEPGRLAAEQAAFGFQFSDVGAELATRWKFPDIFPDTIRDFPAPPAVPAPGRMAAVVHLAVWRARADELGLNAEDTAASLPLNVAAGLGLAPNELLEEMPSLSQLSAGLEELIH
ncbi:HDOD domain-containing protein [Massilia sp. CF038]|uniref:HDOD domain-containing protein n=1 Tax=Massilia sp. CF038 TaxID=1881045 RepID=UPI00091C0794|nr:HDOD domain-containing protein [Massilia sp. CF038]SHH16389.1 HD-like signal output (HDOD) domain, no enzymatic activity [Massilia sp. CF038]